MKGQHASSSHTVRRNRAQRSTDWHSLSAEVFTHPDDVLSDPFLSQSEKRAILASWVSDARALESAPALRQLDNGAVVRLDDILQALKALDRESSSDPSGQIIRLNPRRIARKRAAIPRWVSKVIRRKNDDDDEPPPCPAASAIPIRFSFVEANGRLTGRAEGALVCEAA